jgi:hypothetical protein
MKFALLRAQQTLINGDLPLAPSEERIDQAGEAIDPLCPS